MEVFEETLRDFPYSDSYPANTVVRVKARASFGYVFTGWEGHLTGRDNPEFIVMDCNKWVDATFRIDWRQFGLLIGCILIVMLLVTVIIVRRKGTDE